MAIDFSQLQQTNTQPQEVTQQGTQVLNLSKNQFLNLSKAKPGLTRVKLCAGWDISQSQGVNDLDISCLLLENNAITSADNVVFYNNLSVPGVALSGDNRTGAGEGDDETISIDFSTLASQKPNVTKIICVLTIFDEHNQGLVFGQIRNAYVRLVDEETNNELCRFQLQEEFANDSSILVCELVKDNNQWLFNTLAQGSSNDLNQITLSYFRG